MAFNYNQFPKVSTVSSNDGDENIVSLNGQKYLFSAFLDNGDRVLAIPTPYIEDVSIVDSFRDSSITGSLVYRDPNFSIGRFFDKIKMMVGEDCIDSEFEDKGPSFTFRGTGVEMIHIKFSPLSDEGMEDEFPTGDWVIQNSFVITKIQNKDSVLADNAFRIEFEDIISNVLTNYRIPDVITAGIGVGKIEEFFPTNPDDFEVARKGLADLAVKSANAPDYPTEKPFDKNKVLASKTGEALYWLHYSALWYFQGLTGFKCLEFLPKIGFDGKGYIVDESELKGKKKTWVRKGKTYDVKRSDRDPTDMWDFGSDTSIYFSALDGSGNTRDIVNKFHDVHVSALDHGDSKSLDIVGALSKLNSEQCFFHYSRPETETGFSKMTLRPLYSWFSNFGKIDGSSLGEEYMDRFSLKNEEPFLNMMVGKTKGFSVQSLFCGNENKIKSSEQPITQFVYDPIEPLDSLKFIVPHVVEHHSSGFKTQIFDVDGSVEFCKKFISELYIPFFTDDSNAERGLGKLNVDNTSNSGVVLDQQRPKIRTQTPIPTYTAAIALGRNRLIGNMIFMNDLLNFQTTGQSYRQSGRFFSVDIDGGTDPKDETLNRLLGVWWAMEIKHEIDLSGGVYTNDVTGVKFYRFRKPTDVKGD